VTANSAKRATAGPDDLPDSCTSTINPACLQVGHFASGPTISTHQMIRSSTASPPPLQRKSPIPSVSLASLTYLIILITFRYCIYCARYS
jgi:hypothetical protein